MPQLPAYLNQTGGFQGCANVQRRPCFNLPPKTLSSQRLRQRGMGGQKKKGQQRHTGKEADATPGDGQLDQRTLQPMPGPRGMISSMSWWKPCLNSAWELSWAAPKQPWLTTELGSWRNHHTQTSPQGPESLGESHGCLLLDRL